jgi:hypothetical protein
MEPRTLKQKYVSRKGELWTERSTWISQWQEISRYLLPRNGRFLVTDRNRGEKRHNDIYDSTGTRALRVLAAGLMAGMTSPARPWFRLGTTDKAMMEYGPVKLWLDDVTQLMRDIFARSNTYRALHGLYEELGGFGTAATIVLPDFETVIHHYPVTVGEFSIAQNQKGEVNTLYREFDMTVANVVREFGIKNVSQTVKNLWDRGRLDAWVTVTHVIEPREDRDTRSRLARNLPVASCYFESATHSTANEGSFLRVSGFKRFPALCPRWAGTGGDIYGNSPGMECLGDIKQLQHQQLRKAQGIDYMAKPPVQLPTSMKGMEINTLPGGATYVDPVNGGGMKNAFDVRLELQPLLLDIQDVRMRIDETFYKPLFTRVIMDQRNDRATAREIAEAHEEKLLMIGPVLERLHNELLKRKIDVTFDEMIEAGIVPPPPPEMQGQDLNVEFISMLAQAQRAVGTSAIDRFVGALGQIALVKPGVLDKFDEDQWADQYSDMLGVDPSLIVADENVAIIRQERAKVQQQQLQQQQQAQAAETAAKLASAKTNEPNALTDSISQFSGYGGL